MASTRREAKASASAAIVCLIAIWRGIGFPNLLRSHLGAEATATGCSEPRQPGGMWQTTHTLLPSVSRKYAP